MPSMLHILSLCVMLSFLVIAELVERPCTTITSTHTVTITHTPPSPTVTLQNIGYGMDPLQLPPGDNVESAGVANNASNAHSGESYFAVQFGGSSYGGITLLDYLDNPKAGHSYEAISFFRTAGPNDSCTVTIVALAKPFTGPPIASSDTTELTTTYGQIGLVFTAPATPQIQIEFVLQCTGAFFPSVYVDDTMLLKLS